MVIDRKSEILKHTMDLVQIIGFNNLSYQDLSDRLGIKKASIHHHFSKKDDLGLALLQGIKTNLHDKFNTVLNSNVSPMQKLTDLFSEANSSCRESKICPINSFLSDYHLLSGDQRKILEDIANSEIETVTKILQEGIDRNVFRFKGDTTATALLTLSSLKGAMMYARLKGEEAFKKVKVQLDNLLTS